MSGIASLYFRGARQIHSINDPLHQPHDFYGSCAPGVLQFACVSSLCWESLILLRHLPAENAEV